MILLIVTNYKKARETLSNKGNKKKFLQLLKQGLKEESSQRNAGREEVDFLLKTLEWFSKDVSSSKEVSAGTFFRVLARQALDHHDYWLTPEELYEKLIQ